MKRLNFIGALMLSLLFTSAFGQKLDHYLYDEDTVIVGSDENFYKIDNLGENVNTKHVESGPVISPDGKTLYFFQVDTNFRKAKHAQEYHSDIYVSYYNESDETWSKAKNVGKPLNSVAANSVQAVIKDGEMLILTNKYLKNGLTVDGISYSQRKGDKWTAPEEVKVKFKNDERYSVFVNNAGTIMILAIHDKESIGHQDLFVSFSEDAMKWTKPMHMGTTLNTEMSEATAFLADDDKTLYFSSNGHKGGLGGFDIYKSVRQDSTWTNWSKPKNMGSPYNTKDDEFYFSTPASSEYAYLAHHFVGSDNAEHSDIVRIKLDKPKELVISGFTFDTLTNEKIPATFTVKDIGKEELINSGSSDTTTGYETRVPLGKEYEITFNSPKYKSKTKTIDATELTRYKELVMDVYLEPEPELVLTGFVYDATDSVPMMATITFIDETGKEIQVTATPEEGYKVTLPGGHKYDMITRRRDPDYLDDRHVIDITNLVGRETDERDVYLVPVKKDIVLEIEDIYFAYNKADLKSESFPKLDELVNILLEYPKITVELSAHTDARGSDSYNKSLSQRRAQSTVDYLIEHGIPKKQFVAKGYGEEQIRNQCKNGVTCSDEDHEYNRRVEFKILDVGE